MWLTGAAVEIDPELIGEYVEDAPLYRKTVLQKTVLQKIVLLAFCRHQIQAIQSANISSTKNERVRNGITRRNRTEKATMNLESLLGEAEGKTPCARGEMEIVSSDGSWTLLVV